MVRRSSGGFRWEGVEVLPYKEDGTHFRSISRQTLLVGSQDLPIEYRYFEILPGGYSTLERHEHQHAVMVACGNGSVLVGDQVEPIGPMDIVHIPAMTWHQFQPGQGETLGIFCLVSCERDRPQRPTDADIAKFSPAAREFVKV